MKKLQEKENQKRQLYCKEKNLLQLPIFYFEMANKEKIEISWEEENGRKCEIICCSSEGLPGSLEQDVYAACMRLWILQQMPRAIEVQYTDIAKILLLNPVQWRTKIKKALFKLGAARYKFTHCFIDAKNRTISSTEFFSLFDTAEFQDEKKKGGKWNKNKLYFPEEIKINLEQKYYQWLDFSLYMSIKSGVPRRLYEYLDKRRYHQIEGTFTISEEKLFRWIPLTNKNISSRRKTLRDGMQSLIEMQYLENYQWDRKSKLCSITYGNTLPRMAIEKNVAKKYPTKLASLAEPEEVFSAQPAIAQPEEVFTQTASIAKPKKVLKKTVVELKKIPPEFREILSPEIAERSIEQHEQKKQELREEQLQTLFGMLKSKLIILMPMISEYYDRHGFDYVRWNIQYANEHAKKNYAVYLSKTLAENWSLVQQEEQKQKELQRQETQRKAQEAAIQAQQEELARERNEQLKQKLRLLFKQKIDALAPEIKEEFWQQAISIINANKTWEKMPQTMKIMQVKLQYKDLLRNYFNECGDNFSKTTVDGIAFAKEIAWKTEF